jgi:hypothetical protein
MRRTITPGWEFLFLPQALRLSRRRVEDRADVLQRVSGNSHDPGHSRAGERQSTLSSHGMSGL